MRNMPNIEKRLANIEMLIKQLPEVQAATYLTMREEYETARLQGKKCKDLWTIDRPD